MLRLVCPPPCTIVCACLRQSQAQNSFKFNSNVTFCVIFSLAFLFSFCFGIFGDFDKCSDGAGRQERERGIERGRGPKKHCHWTFKSIWIRRRIRARVRSTFAVLVCLFSFPAQTVRYVVVISVIVVVVCVCFVKFHCYPKNGCIICTHIFSYFSLSLSLSRAFFLFWLETWFMRVFSLLLFLLSFVLMGCILFYVAGRVCNTSSH